MGDTRRLHVPGVFRIRGTVFGINLSATDGKVEDILEGNLLLVPPLDFLYSTLQYINSPILKP